jgi:hypothetical protein
MIVKQKENINININIDIDTENKRGTSETIRENLKKFNDFYDFNNFSF